MMAESVAEEIRVCDSLECEKIAKLQCPTCKNLGIVEGSFFCEQVCYPISYICSTINTCPIPSPPAHESHNKAVYNECVTWFIHPSHI